MQCSGSSQCQGVQLGIKKMVEIGEKPKHFSSVRLDEDQDMDFQEGDGEGFRYHHSEDEYEN